MIGESSTSRNIAYIPTTPGPTAQQKMLLPAVALLQFWLGKCLLKIQASPTSGAILVLIGYVPEQLVFVTLQANNKRRWHFSIMHVEFSELARSTAFCQYLTCGV
jgi:hypothetical protein